MEKQKLIVPIDGKYFELVFICDTKTKQFAFLINEYDGIVIA